MDQFEVRQWPKTSRLLSRCVMSEKLDGSNCCVIVEEDENGYRLGAQTRTKLATRYDDQLGFYRWVEDNATTLIEDLGVGYHYGEFVKGKGLAEPHLFLFNTKRWTGVHFTTPSLKVVPVLFEGEYSQAQLDECVKDLEDNGSRVLATPAEGVIVFWRDDETSKKYFCKGKGRK